MSLTSYEKSGRYKIERNVTPTFEIEHSDHEDQQPDATAGRWEGPADSGARRGITQDEDDTSEDSDSEFSEDSQDQEAAVGHEEQEDHGANRVSQKAKTMPRRTGNLNRLPSNDHHAWAQFLSGWTVLSVMCHAVGHSTVRLLQLM